VVCEEVVGLRRKCKINLGYHNSDATPKLYALNLEVKYKDPEGEWAISEPAKAVINVTPAKPPYMLYGIVGLIIVAAVIVYLKRR